MQVVENAINQLIKMRENEGKKISEDIKARIAIVNDKIQEIFILSTGLIDEYVVKLETRIKEILKTEELEYYRF